MDPYADTLRTPNTHHRIPTVARPTWYVQAPADVPLPEAARLQRYLQRWIVRELGGWIQLAVLELLDQGRVEWRADVCGGPTQTAVRLLAVRCVDRPGPQRPGLWAALSVARALAELLGGRVIERPRASQRARAQLRAPADGRVHAIDHLWFPNSRGRTRERWVSSVGMAQFGLPDVEIVSVPKADVELAAKLLLGVAQHLIDAPGSWTRDGRYPREVLLTIGELHCALGGDIELGLRTSGRGWTRVAVGSHAGRAGLGLRLRPPLGARTWADNGVWLHDALRDLCGRKIT